MIGLTSIRMKDDPEASALELRDEVIKALKRDNQKISLEKMAKGDVDDHDMKQIIPERSPVGSKQSNGMAERAVQMCMNMSKALILDIQHTIGKKIPYESTLMDWLLIHASDLLNRTRVMDNGKTPI